VDGIFHLLRAFDNDEVVHVDDSIDPVKYHGDDDDGDLCLLFRLLNYILVLELIRFAKSKIRRFVNVLYCCIGALSCLFDTNFECLDLCADTLSGLIHLVIIVH
jgi:hypothetical protein